ncbi:unnamed protein product [Polarella glacialis]|uniref:Uncharacterized protein n=1 Tax=Polarella glacialis TaxID=89957 RepID=A0A813H579_POLGL|nr:unnamed protein product [Polarella glacialis]
MKQKGQITGDSSRSSSRGNLSSLRLSEKLIKSREVTSAKFHAMWREAKTFYRSYPGQSWKNIISVGDMRYEHDAVQGLGMSRRTSHGDRLLIKSLLLPGSASITEITLRLRFSQCMIPAYVRFDGDLDLNLRDADDPLDRLAEALGMPDILLTGFTRHAWGKGALEDEEQTRQALKKLRRVVQRAWDQHSPM